MSIKDLGTVSESGALTAKDMLTTPFIEGRDVEAVVDCDAFNGTVKIQGSNDDGDSWTDLMTVTETGTGRTVRETITLSRKMRANCTSYSAGEADCHLRAGD